MNDQTSGFKQTIQWYNENAEDYSSKIENSPNIELIERFVNAVGHGVRILDAGCAAGRDCRIFKDKGLVPVGIDLTESLIKLAEQKNQDIEFHIGSFLELPFEDESYDGVWSNASLLHLEKIDDVETALKEFSRVLKFGGHLHIFVKQQLGEEKTTTTAHDYSGEFKRFFRFFTKLEIQRLVENAGFEIIDIEDDYTTPDGRADIKWIAVLARKS
jgi:ubiquinone/menaquinone biosynthesis C-methylase UbiE